MALGGMDPTMSSSLLRDPPALAFWDPAAKAYLVYLMKYFEVKGLKLLMEGV